MKEDMKVVWGRRRSDYPDVSIFTFSSVYHEASSFMVYRSKINQVLMLLQPFFSYKHIGKCSEITG